MNSLPGSDFQYSVTSHIDLIQIRPNSLWQTEYHSYLMYVCQNLYESEYNRDV